MPKHKHNMYRTRTYRTWDNIIQRCTNSKNTNYYKYKERGISVCDRWMTFSNFYEDMGIRPENKTIDRIDNNKGYYKENCRWATIQEQSMNKRNTKWFYMNGFKLSSRDLSKLAQTNIKNIHYRSRKERPLYEICPLVLGG